MKLAVDNREAAFEYANRGWAVMPLQANKKDPHFELCKRAYLSATTDIKLINFWFDFDPNINIGIACQTSGLVVFDIDFVMVANCYLSSHQHTQFKQEMVFICITKQMQLTPIVAS